MQQAFAKYARCATCRNSCAQPSDADITHEANQQAADERWARAAEQWRDRVPERFKDARSGEPALLDALNSWRKGSRTSLLAVGYKGVGKTHLGYAMLNQLVEARLAHPARILAGSEAELLAAISLSGFDKSEQLRRTVMNPRRWDVIMIDDVGFSTFNRNDRVNLWRELADHMWSHGKALIITTNLELTRTVPSTGGDTITEKPLEAWVGDAAYDRITHMTRGNAVHIDGTKSRRRSDIDRQTA